MGLRMLRMYGFIMFVIFMLTLFSRLSIAFRSMCLSEGYSSYNDATLYPKATLRLSLTCSISSLNFLHW